MLLAQVINFAILAFVLTKLVYKPLIGALEEREATVKKISENNSSAENLLEEARTKQEEILRDARASTQKMMKQSEDAAEARAKTILDAARKDAEKIIADGAKKLDEEQKKFYSNLKAELAGLVSAGIESTVGKYITKDAEAKLKDEALAKALTLKK